MWATTWEVYRQGKLRPRKPPGARRVFRQKFRLIRVRGRAVRRRGFSILSHCSRVRVIARRGYSSFFMIEVWIAWTVSLSLKNEMRSRSAQLVVHSHNSLYWSSWLPSAAKRTPRVSYDSLNSSWRTLSLTSWVSLMNREVFSSAVVLYLQSPFWFQWKSTPHHRHLSTAIAPPVDLMRPSHRSSACCMWTWTSWKDSLVLAVWIRSVSSTKA